MSFTMITQKYNCVNLLKSKFIENKKPNHED